MLARLISLAIESVQVYLVLAKLYHRLIFHIQLTMVKTI